MKLTPEVAMRAEALYQKRHPPCDVSPEEEEEAMEAIFAELEEEEAHLLAARRAEFLRLMEEDARADELNRAKERDIDASDYQYPAGEDRHE